MGGAINAISNVVNQVSNVINQVSQIFQQGIQLFQGIQNGLQGIQNAFQGNNQDNNRADAAAQRAVDDRQLEQARQERARAQQRV